MPVQFARGERTTDAEGRTAIDVSGVEIGRVTEHVGEWFPDASDVYVERKGGRTYLVAGER